MVFKYISLQKVVFVWFKSYVEGNGWSKCWCAVDRRPFLEGHWSE